MWNLPFHHVKNSKLLLDQPLGLSVHRCQRVFMAGAHAQCLVLQHTLRSTAIVIWRQNKTFLTFLRQTRALHTSCKGLLRL